MLQIWSIFIDLHNTRTAGMSGANPIAYSEILAYYSLNKEEPEVWEVKTIKRLDSVVLQYYAELQAKEQQKAQAKSKSK